MVNAKQTLYSGLAFSQDGTHLYASMGSRTNPEGDGKPETGSGIVVYSFNRRQDRARLAFSTFPCSNSPREERPSSSAATKAPKGIPFPAAIAVLPSSGGNGERLLIADNLSDDVLLLDAATGSILKRFDLAESNAVPSTYPVALAVTKDGTRAFVALWNASEIVEIYLATETIGRKLPLLKPTSPIAARHASLRVPVFSRREHSLRSARQSRRRGRRKRCRQCLRASRATSTPAFRTRATSARSPRPLPSVPTANVST